MLNGKTVIAFPNTKDTSTPVDIFISILKTYNCDTVFYGGSKDNIDTDWSFYKINSECYNAISSRFTPQDIEHILNQLPTEMVLLEREVISDPLLIRHVSLEGDYSSIKKEGLRTSKSGDFGEGLYCIEDNSDNYTAFENLSIFVEDNYAHLPKKDLKDIYILDIRALYTEGIYLECVYTSYMYLDHKYYILLENPIQPDNISDIIEISVYKFIYH